MTGSETAGRTAGWVRTLGNALGIGVGVAVGQYAGIYLLIPFVATAAVWWAGMKLLQDNKKIIVSSLAVNTGHFSWLAIGVMVTGVLNADAWDLVVYAVGIAWLVARPGAGPLYLLGAYQALSLVVNAIAFADAAVGSSAHKALLIHLIWRSLALIVIGRLWITLRQRSETTA